MKVSNRFGHYLAVAGLSLALISCGEAEEKSADVKVRPVLYVIVEPTSINDGGFTGTIEPRYSTDLAFRVLGRVISRPVNVGDLVRRGATVATIDPAALDLNVQASRADLASAQAQATNAMASEERQRILLQGNNISQAAYDAAKQARDSAEAGLEKARAGLRKAQDQRGYAQLQPDFDGVVSATQAEVGQVVAAGQPVVTIARPDIREAVVDVPDSLVGIYVPGATFDVQSQADPSVTGTGTVREVSPQADPQTRSRRVRIALENPDPGFRLGATVRVSRAGVEATNSVALPLSALLERDGSAFVWLIDPHSQQVRLTPVGILSRHDNSFVSDNIAVGSYVVTAGVHQLTDGQRVGIIEKGNRN